MGVQDNIKWVSVISFDLDHEAGLCASYLESHDIRTHMKNEFIARSYPSISASTGGIQIMVADVDVIKASVLLEKAGYIKPGSAGEPILNTGNIIKIALIVISLIALALLALSVFGNVKSNGNDLSSLKLQGQSTALHHN